MVVPAKMEPTDVDTILVFIENASRRLMSSDYKISRSIPDIVDRWYLADRGRPRTGDVMTSFPSLNVRGIRALTLP
jgi:hypothetical protein